MSPITTPDQLRDIPRLFRLESDDTYSVSLKDANFISLLARSAARDIDDLQKKADALEHWRNEVGKLHSQIARKDAEILELRAALAQASAA